MRLDALRPVRALALAVHLERVEPVKEQEEPPTSERRASAGRVGVVLVGVEDPNDWEDCDE